MSIHSADAPLYYARIKKPLRVVPVNMLSCSNSVLGSYTSSTVNNMNYLTSVVRSSNNSMTLANNFEKASDLNHTGSGIIKFDRLTYSLSPATNSYNTLSGLTPIISKTVINYSQQFYKLLIIITLHSIKNKILL